MIHMFPHCLTRRRFSAVLTSALIFYTVSCWELRASSKLILILNEDDSHFFGSRSAEQMNLEELHAFVHNSPLLPGHGDLSKG